MARDLYISLDGLERSGALRDSTGRFGLGGLGTSVTSRAPTDQRFAREINFAGTNSSANQVTLNGGAADWTFGALPFSVEVWFKTSTAQQGRIWSADDNSHGLFDLKMNGVSGVMAFEVYTSARSNITSPTTSGTNYADGFWHHCVGVRKVSTPGEIWVDGKLAATASDSGGVQSSPVAADLGFFVNAPYTGQIGPARIWKRALSAPEIAQLFAEPFAMLRSPGHRSFGRAA